ncbi:MAG: CcmD family protein [Bacteroidetes bacterium]|nr:CcmD family protein [Bacteroidota bacterium]MBS1630022.1 CcmD family protein [Bacteroidota bacterium]
MNQFLRYLSLLSLILLLSFSARASSIADALNGENKIWVVVLVLATIFAGIILFLVYLDRRIARLERDSSQAGTSKNKQNNFQVQD